jgi:hypothetical protein
MAQDAKYVLRKKLEWSEDIAEGYNPKEECSTTAATVSV